MDETDVGFDAAMSAQRFNPFSPEYGPHFREIYQHMRGNCPVAHTGEPGGVWVVTRYDEIARVLRDPETLAGAARTTSERQVPYCVFTDPPLAHIGLNERDAQRQGIAVRVGKLPMSAVLRREATDETLGFMKVLVGADDDHILGFTMLGADAGEVVAAIQTAMLAGLPYPKLRDAVIAHLTTAEGLGPLLENVPLR
jgi:hypothetical protein